MSLGSHLLQAATATRVIDTVSAANTAAATSSWIDVSAFEGDLLFLQYIGAVTGSITGKIQDADDTSGTNSADVSGATFTAVSSANNLQKLTVSSNSVRKAVRYVGTIVTGPALTSVSVLAHPKYV